MNKLNLHLKTNTAIPVIDWLLVDSKAGASTPDCDSPELQTAQRQTLRPLRQAIPSSKSRITIMVDDLVLQAYKAKAGGRGYQTLMNETLRRSLDTDMIKESLRQVLREERAQAT